MKFVTTTFLHKICIVIAVHWNNDLFSRWTLCGYVDIWFELTIIFNDFLDIFNFICFERRKDFFDSKDFLSIASQF